MYPISTPTAVATPHFKQTVAISTADGATPFVPRNYLQVMARSPHRIRAVAPKVGAELRRLRSSRSLSQLDLALAAGVSARHVSFVETGRSTPGRDLLLQLGQGLSLTHSETASLLASGGYATAPDPIQPTLCQLEPVLPAVREVLESLEPVPAALVDGRWDLVMPNRAYAVFVERLFGRTVFPRGGLSVTDAPRPNRGRLMFERPGMRCHLRNWDELASGLLARIRMEARLTREDSLVALADELVATPGVPSEWKAADFRPPRVYPILARFRFGRRDVRVYSIVNAWATTMPGLRIELLHPVNERSQRALESLCGPRATPVQPQAERHRTNH
jgi:transcriptional regulator with XRE-family HTH domain